MSLAFQIPNKLPLDDPVACAKLLERIEFEEFKAKKRIETEWESNKILYLPRPLAYHEEERTGYKGPNPKQQLIIDAWRDQKYKVFTYCGGNRCLTYDTLVETVKGEVPVGKLYDSGKPFKVYSWDGDRKVEASAGIPFKKRKSQTYRIEMFSGKTVEVSGSHRILTDKGWLSARMLHKIFLEHSSPCSRGKYSFFLDRSSSEPFLSILPSGVLSLSGIGLDLRDRYFGDSHQYDGPPLMATDIGLTYSPSQVDALRRTYVSVSWRKDDLGNKLKHIHHGLSTRRPSILDGLRHYGDRFVESLSRIFDKTWSSFLPEYRLSPLLSGAGDTGFLSSPAVAQHQSFSLGSCEPPLSSGNRIYSIRPIDTCQDVYDFEVEKYHNYYAGGLVHHNSGKTVLWTWLAISVLRGEFPWSGEKLWFPHNKPRKVRVVGQDWEKHIKTVVEPALLEWWPKCWKVDKKKNNVGVEALWTDAKTKSTLEIMSNNQESDLHEGWHGDLICYDEPPKRDIRVANARGLVDRQGREIFCMTLLKEAWVDREVVKARNEDGTLDQSVYSVNTEIYDNVGYGITNEGVDQFAKTLRPDEKDSRLRGIPSYMHGIVLTNFRRERNLIPRIKKLPLDWIIDVAIDFHPSKPWDVLFMATDGRNFKYLVDEIHEHGNWKTIGEDIVRKLKKHGCRVNIIEIDPLAKGDAQSDLAGESVFDKLSILFMAYGYCLQTASKDKENGIVMVNDLLFTQNEMPALFVFDDLKVATQQMEDWMYDMETGKPSKDDDDMCENLYRLVLLGTQYSSPADEDDEWENRRRYANGNHGRNRITGY